MPTKTDVSNDHNEATAAAHQSAKSNKAATTKQFSFIHSFFYSEKDDPQLENNKNGCPTFLE